MRKEEGRQGKEKRQMGRFGPEITPEQSIDRTIKEYEE